MGIDVADANDIVPYGMPMVTDGLVMVQGTNGYGLFTNGFLWQVEYIWFSPETVDGVSTSWGPYSFGTTTTTWTASSFGPTTTTWTLSQWGLFSDAPPRIE